MDAALIKAEFKKRRKRQFAVMIVALPLIVVMGFVMLFSEGTILHKYEDVVMYIMLGIFFSFLIFTMFNWRCPQCDSILGNKLNANYCSNCGAALK
jgi:hypothetical protein